MRGKGTGRIRSSRQNRKRRVRIRRNGHESLSSLRIQNPVLGGRIASAESSGVDRVLQDWAVAAFAAFGAQAASLQDVVRYAHGLHPQETFDVVLRIGALASRRRGSTTFCGGCTSAPLRRPTLCRGGTRRGPDTIRPVFNSLLSAEYVSASTSERDSVSLFLILDTRLITRRPQRREPWALVSCCEQTRNSSTLD